MPNLNQNIDDLQKKMSDLQSQMDNINSVLSSHKHRGADGSEALQGDIFLTGSDSLRVGGLYLHSQEVTKTPAQYATECSFESTDAFTPTGTTGLDGLSGAYLYVEQGVVSLSILRSLIVFPVNFMDWSKDISLKTSFWSNISPLTYNFYATLGSFNSATNIEGFGFRVINGLVSGVFGKGAGAVFTSTFKDSSTSANLDPTKVHDYAAFYQATQKRVVFYVDGIQQAIISSIFPTVNFEPNMDYQAQPNGAGTLGKFYIQNLFLTRQI